MASINELVSEMAHAVGQPNNHSVREQLRLAIIQTRNEVIRRSYENHNYVDRALVQRFKVSLRNVNDGEITLPEGIEDSDITKILRTEQAVPRPVRLTNNLPFDRVSTVGYKTNREIPFVKETTARFVNKVPGLCGSHCYDYINGYIYIFPTGVNPFMGKYIIIESDFEHPNEIEYKSGNKTAAELELDDNQYILSEDMIGQIKEIIYKRDFFNNIRQNNETSIDTKHV